MPLLPELARLRVCVFREFPYLYEGNPAYEQAYLRTYAEASGAAVIVALDGEHVAGASTCLPLSLETANVQKPFLEAGEDVSKIFYFGESVLEAPYRGRGIGVEFFAAREAQARASLHTITAFCAVQRPATHKLRPAGYVPLDDFWRRRGYAKRPELTCAMSWRDVGEAAESEKTMTFWTRTL